MPLKGQTQYDVELFAEILKSLFAKWPNVRFLIWIIVFTRESRVGETQSNLYREAFMGSLRLLIIPSFKLRNNISQRHRHTKKIPQSHSTMLKRVRLPLNQFGEYDVSRNR